LLEDFILREKITHFDHERIPERIVHARGTGVHGFFELTASLKRYTTAKILTAVGEKTPVFTRISTVAGGAGSVDAPREVRGFAVKFYTKEGNWDLVGNIIPVFFIQDALKFPDLAHAVKMEPDRGFPQSSTGHDTFWDFISLTPESMQFELSKVEQDAAMGAGKMRPNFGLSFSLIAGFRSLDAPHDKLPGYVVLCNFDEFWIYDFDTELDTPKDKLATKHLPQLASPEPFGVEQLLWLSPGEG
jgi:catalase